jgi:hypothetical protein
MAPFAGTFSHVKLSRSIGYTRGDGLYLPVPLARFAVRSPQLGIRLGGQSHVGIFTPVCDLLMQLV